MAVGWGRSCEHDEASCGMCAPCSSLVGPTGASSQTDRIPVRIPDRTPPLYQHSPLRQHAHAGPMITQGLSLVNTLEGGRQHSPLATMDQRHWNTYPQPICLSDACTYSLDPAHSSHLGPNHMHLAAFDLGNSSLASGGGEHGHRERHECSSWLMEGAASAWAPISSQACCEDGPARPQELATLSPIVSVHASDAAAICGSFQGGSSSRVLGNCWRSQGKWAQPAKEPVLAPSNPTRPPSQPGIQWQDGRLGLAGSLFDGCMSPAMFSSSSKGSSESFHTGPADCGLRSRDSKGGSDLLPWHLLGEADIEPADQACTALAFWPTTRTSDHEGAPPARHHLTCSGPLQSSSALPLDMFQQHLQDILPDVPGLDKAPKHGHPAGSLQTKLHMPRGAKPLGVASSNLLAAEGARPGPVGKGNAAGELQAANPDRHPGMHISNGAVPVVSPCPTAASVPTYMRGATTTAADTNNLQADEALPRFAACNRMPLDLIHEFLCTGQIPSRPSTSTTSAAQMLVDAALGPDMPQPAAPRQGPPMCQGGIQQPPGVHEKPDILSKPDVLTAMDFDSLDKVDLDAWSLPGKQMHITRSGASSHRCSSSGQLPPDVRMQGPGMAPDAAELAAGGPAACPGAGRRYSGTMDRMAQAEASARSRGAECQKLRRSTRPTRPLHSVLPDEGPCPSESDKPATPNPKGAKGTEAGQGRRQGNATRRAGRPIIPVSNPNGGALTPGQQRLVRRRLHNRESARRSRIRRQALAEQQSDKVLAAISQTSALQEEVEKLKGHSREYRERVCQLEHRHSSKMAECARLEQQIEGLRAGCPVQQSLCQQD